VLDVIVAGAGPAGSIAALTLARAGARVLIIDRATFPRDKLCGDTVNPGTLAVLRRLGLSKPIDDRGLRVEGMRVTGPRGVAVEGRYPDGLHGRALVRSDLDWALLQQAIDAGARFEPSSAVRRAIVEESEGSRSVCGVVVGLGGREREIRAPVTLAADGRRSTLAFGLGLARHPRRPRRWAIGAYYENAGAMSSLGEMHVRRGRYIGVAAVPGGIANVCLVRPFDEKGVGRLFVERGVKKPPDPFFAALLAAELAGDPLLRARFADARLVQPPVVLGPLAVEVSPTRIRGLLLAGDAAGFIDPMTGDGLRFAVQGGVLAAEAALQCLTEGWSEVHERLERARHREFAPKWRFNRALRALVASSRGTQVAGIGARLAPGMLRRVITTAGDCAMAGSTIAPC
jgi:flavin-dependent dehydrogenase